MSQLGKACQACGRERSKTKAVMYDPETLFAYCESPYICNDKHPNAPKNLLKRGSELQLISLVDAQKIFKEQLMETVGDPERIAKIRQMVDKPTTIRIGSPDLAIFLLDLQDSFGFGSIADTVRYCIQEMKDRKGEMYQEFKRVDKVLNEKKKVNEVIQSIEQSEELPQPEVKPEEETKEEEWTF